MMLDRYAGWDESLSGRRDRSRNGSGRCIKEDTDMDDDDGGMTQDDAQGMLDSLKDSDVMASVRSVGGTLTDSPEGSTFGYILPDGEFLDLGSYSPWDVHQDFWQDVCEDVTGNDDSDFEGLSEMFLNEFEERLKLIRYNCGTGYAESRCYCVILGRPPRRQEKALGDWLQHILADERSESQSLSVCCSVSGVPGYSEKRFDLTKTGPDEVLESVRRYYSTGMLESKRCTDTDGSGDIPLMEDTEMDKKRFDRLLDYAEKRRDDPDASSTDVRYWAGYIDGLRALMKGSGGNESLSEIEALRRLR